MVCEKVRDGLREGQRRLQPQRYYISLIVLYFARLFVPLNKLLTLENKNKSRFILYFARLFVTLASPKVLSFDNKNKKNRFLFCIVLTYS